MALNVPTFTSEAEKQRLDQATHAVLDAYQLTGMRAAGLVEDIGMSEVEKWPKPSRSAIRKWVMRKEASPFDADEFPPKWEYKRVYEHFILYVGVDAELGLPESDSGAVVKGPTSRVRMIFVESAQTHETAVSKGLKKVQITVDSGLGGPQLAEVKVDFKEPKTEGTMIFAPGSSSQVTYHSEKKAFRPLGSTDATWQGSSLYSNLFALFRDRRTTPEDKCRKIINAEIVGPDELELALNPTVQLSERQIFAVRREASQPLRMTREAASRLVTGAVEEVLDQEAAQQEEKIEQAFINKVIHMLATDKVTVDRGNAAQMVFVRNQARELVAAEEERLSLNGHPIGKERVKKHFIHESFNFEKSTQLLVVVLEEFGLLEQSDLLVKWRPTALTRQIKMGWEKNEDNARTNMRDLYAAVEKTEPLAEYIKRVRAQRPAKYAEFLDWTVTMHIPQNEENFRRVPVKIRRPSEIIRSGIGASCIHKGVVLTVETGVMNEGRNNVASESFHVECALPAGNEKEINAISVCEDITRGEKTTAVTLYHRSMHGEPVTECRIVVTPQGRFVEFWQVPQIYVEKGSPPNSKIELRTDTLFPCLPEEVDPKVRSVMEKTALKMLHRTGLSQDIEARLQPELEKAEKERAALVQKYANSVVEDRLRALLPKEYANSSLARYPAEELEKLKATIDREAIVAELEDAIPPVDMSIPRERTAAAIIGNQPIQVASQIVREMLLFEA